MIKGLPEKLRQLRTNANLSQRDVAKKLRISPSIVSSYETGERTPSLENLLSLSYLYKCSTDYLLGKDSGPQPSYIDVSKLNHNQINAINLVIENMNQN